MCQASSILAIDADPVQGIGVFCLEVVMEAPDKYGIAVMLLAIMMKLTLPDVPWFGWAIFTSGVLILLFVD